MAVGWRDCRRGEKMIKTRFATDKDIPKIMDLLRQVHGVHYDIRPDVFKPVTTKYTADELADILKDKTRPIIVGVNEADETVGYAFCIIKEIKDHQLLCDSKSLYIDDLCVDEKCRGEHIGTAVYEAVCEYAKSIGCDTITLNVWEGNDSARVFYDAKGFTPRSTTMEVKL